MLYLRIIRLWMSEFLFVVYFIKLKYRVRSCSVVFGIIMIVIACDCPEIKGAFEKKEVGASSFALGNAAVAIDHYLYALYYNPAALSKDKSFQIAFSLQNYFGLRDLNSVDLTTNFSMAGYPVSFAINRFGNQNYQEIQITAASRYEFFQHCAIGISVQCYILSIRHYGQTSAWGINFSVLYKVLPSISIGTMVTNLNQPVISSIRETLPQTMNLGICYVPISDLLVSFEIFQDLRFPYELRAGFSYQILSLLTIRAGIEDHLNIYGFGIGVKMEWINFDYALRNHPALGISHIITFSVVL